MRRLGAAMVIVTSMAVGMVVAAVLGSATPDAVEMVAPTPTITQEATPTLTPTLVSEATSTAVPPTPATPTPVPQVVTDLNRLQLPEGTTINRSGCASDGSCSWFNFWWTDTNEAVVQPDEPYIKEVHELCHGHQDWSIGRPLTPDERHLRGWYGTAEGVSFSEAVAGLSWPWTHGAQNGLEDFAWTCAMYYTSPSELRQISIVRHEWALENLP